MQNHNWPKQPIPYPAKTFTLDWGEGSGRYQQKKLVRNKVRARIARQSRNLNRRTGAGL